MHDHLIANTIARRLRALADEPAATPYDWAEFQRRAHRAMLPRSIGRNRVAVMAIAAAAMAVATFVVVRSNHPRTTVLAPGGIATRTSLVQPTTAAGSLTTPDRAAQARTRAMEGWLAGLPHDPAVVRVGAHAAVISLQDQIAALDDLMSAERVADVRPGNLGLLERRRAQLVSSLAQLRYAELLAAATP